MWLVILALAFADVEAVVDLLNHLVSGWLIGNDPVITEGQLVKLAMALDAHLDLVTRKLSKGLFDPRLVVAPRKVNVMGRCITHSTPCCQSTWPNNYTKPKKTQQIKKDLAAFCINGVDAFTVQAGTGLILLYYINSFYGLIINGF